MTRLQIDFEHTSREWWEAGGEDLWGALVGDSGDNHVIVDDDISESWLREAEKLPGWNAGHEFAPHPIVASLLAEDEENI